MVAPGPAGREQVRLAAADLVEAAPATGYSGVKAYSRGDCSGSRPLPCPVA
jgi:hypothetical protein